MKSGMFLVTRTLLDSKESETRKKQVPETDDTSTLDSKEQHLIWSC